MRTEKVQTKLALFAVLTLLVFGAVLVRAACSQIPPSLPSTPVIPDLQKACSSNLLTAAGQLQIISNPKADDKAKQTACTALGDFTSLSTNLNQCITTLTQLTTSTDKLFADTDQTMADIVNFNMCCSDITNLNIPDSCASAEKSCEASCSGSTHPEICQSSCVSEWNCGARKTQCDTAQQTLSASASTAKAQMDQKFSAFDKSMAGTQQQLNAAKSQLVYAKSKCTELLSGGTTSTISTLNPYTPMKVAAATAAAAALTLLQRSLMQVLLPTVGAPPIINAMTSAPSTLLPSVSTLDIEAEIASWKAMIESPERLALFDKYARLTQNMVTSSRPTAATQKGIDAAIADAEDDSFAAFNIWVIIILPDKFNCKGSIESCIMSPPAS